MKSETSSILTSSIKTSLMEFGASLLEFEASLLEFGASLLEFGAETARAQHIVKVVPL